MSVVKRHRCLYCFWGIGRFGGLLIFGVIRGFYFHIYCLKIVMVRAVVSPQNSLGQAGSRVRARFLVG